MLAKLWMDLHIALRNLIEHRRRTAILLGAAAAVTCLYVLLASLLTGVRYTTIQAATSMTTGHVNIGGFYKLASTQPSPILTDYAEVAAVARRALPEAEAVVQRGRGWGRMVSDEGVAVTTAITGIDIETEPRIRSVLQVESGDLSGLASPDTVVLFEEQASKLGVRVGDVVTITAAAFGGLANTLDCRVVAVVHELGALSRILAFVSNASWRKLYRLQPTAAGALQIIVGQQHVEHLGPLVERLRHALHAAGYRVMEPDPQPIHLKLEAVSQEDWSGQMLDVTTWDSELPTVSWTLELLRGASGLVSMILLLIMLAGVANALSVAVRERTREIGTLRAIGIQRSGVARLFLLEAALLGAGGASLGAGIGAGAAALINAAGLPVPTAAKLFLMSHHVTLALEPGTLAAVIATITLATSCAALVPALRAARRKPVEAMAHFG